MSVVLAKKCGLCMPLAVRRGDFSLNSWWLARVCAVWSIINLACVCGEHIFITSGSRGVYHAPKPANRPLTPTRHCSTAESHILTVARTFQSFQSGAFKA